VTDVRFDVTPVLDGEFQVDMSLVTTVGVCTLTESMTPTIAFTGGVVVGADANCSPFARHCTYLPAEIRLVNAKAEVVSSEAIETGDGTGGR
jgi:hypothetical protein